MEYTITVRNRSDYLERRNKIKEVFGKTLEELMKEFYKEKQMSCAQISKKLKEKGINFSERSLARVAEKLGIVRSNGDAFRLAVKQGRVKWAYKDPRLKANRKRLPTRTRLQILNRDNFKCKFCGAGPQTTNLEVDHIIPLTQNGTNDPSNLQTLCHECNVGKRLLNDEH